MKKGLPATTSLSWQESYAAAMLELDPGCLPGRIEAAQSAIRHAMEQMAGPRGSDCAEMQEMSSALGNLQTLQRVTHGGLKPAEPGLS